MLDDASPGFGAACPLHAFGPLDGCALVCELSPSSLLKVNMIILLLSRSLSVSMHDNVIAFAGLRL